METEYVSEVSSYNYRRFRPEEYALDRFPGPQVGEQAPDLIAHDLDGRRVGLSDFRGRAVVLETGSYTCPQYVARIPGMNALARRHPETAFVVLYVREAHPGSRVGPHGDEADKRTYARRTVAEDAERRTVLADDLDGAAHREWGALPNMVYVLDAAGTVAFRGPWNNVAMLSQVLDRMLTGRPTIGLATGFRPVGVGALLRVLTRAGWDAVADFARALPRLIRTHRRVARTGYRA